MNKTLEISECIINLMPKIKPVILCGGSGTRLWPLSRESFPKQFVPLIDGQSLLDLTIRRVKDLGLPICITNEEHRFFVQDLLSQYSNFSACTILLEPEGRNTAAAMAIAGLSPGVVSTDLLLFLPSDHFLPNANLFLATIKSGITAAQNGYIVTFGVQPTFPSSAYGYIQQGDRLSDSDLTEQETVAGYVVNRYVEKPVFEKAQEMLLSGDFLWNSGIFLCQANTLLGALEKYAPDILQSCQSAMNSSLSDGNFVRPDCKQFLNCRAESIDYAVMEHFEKVAVIPLKGVWSDVGSWNSVAALSDVDDCGNRISGQGLAIESQNTYINAPHRPVVALGADNLIIIDTVDAVLVSARDKVEQVKDVVARLKKNGASQAILHRRVFRPWGCYDTIDIGDRFQVKRITVKPGASLSLQLHQHRAEHWIVVKGVAQVTNGENIFSLSENQSTYVPIGVKHRLENIGQTDLEMIEVQSGDYLGEDDIIRFKDNYGRS